MFKTAKFTGAAFTLMAACTWAQAQSPVPGSGFERIARYQALGGLMASTVAPGPTPGSERLYASYLYADNTLDVIAVDPSNGQAEVFHNAAPGEFGARNISVGPDGDVYLGSLPGAHFLRVDRHAHRMVDLGRPSPSEQYIWDVAFGADHRLYGVTYPNCRLVRYDPATHKLEDLGRMDPTEKYGRWIVAGKDGYMYIGIGTARAGIVIYNTRTGEMRQVLPDSKRIVGTPKPFIGADGHAYATLDDQTFALDGFRIRELPAHTSIKPANADVLRDGRILTLSDDDSLLTITDPKTNATHKLPINYTGEDLQVFRIGFASNGQLYGSSILPIHFLHVDVAAHHVDQIGELGGGEIYSFLPYRGRLLMGAYSGLSPLMNFDPSAPVHPAADGNPQLIHHEGVDHAWRPQAMIVGADGRVYVGGTAGYGELEGPLLAWDGTPESVTLYGNLVHNQSVISLAAWKEFIVGGTTTTGGGGSHPTETSAHVFLWNTKTHAKDFDFVPVEKAESITDLIASRSGVVYGVALSHDGRTLFAFDPQSRKMLSRQNLPFQDVVYNGVGLDAAGRIVGLATEGVFAIDEEKHEARLIAPSPVKITGGFDIRDGYIYFISNSEIYRWREEPAHAR